MKNEMMFAVGEIVRVVERSKYARTIVWEIRRGQGMYRGPHDMNDVLSFLKVQYAVTVLGFVAFPNCSVENLCGECIKYIPIL